MDAANERSLRVTIQSLIQSGQLVTISIDDDRQITGRFRSLNESQIFFESRENDQTDFAPSDIRSIWRGSPEDPEGEFIWQRENTGANLAGLRITTAPPLSQTPSTATM